jgi:hypothetical protein
MERKAHELIEEACSELTCGVEVEKEARSPLADVCRRGHHPHLGYTSLHHLE